MLEHLARYESEGKLSGEFWEHIYNIGGGESCRVSTAEMHDRLYGELGFWDLSVILKPKMQATRNFHGQYYLDSDRLEDYLHFRNDSMEYFYREYLKNFGIIPSLAKKICKKPGGQLLMEKSLVVLSISLPEKKPVRNGLSPTTWRIISTLSGAAARRGRRCRRNTEN